MIPMRRKRGTFGQRSDAQKPQDRYPSYTTANTPDDTEEEEQHGDANDDQFTSGDGRLDQGDEDLIPRNMMPPPIQNAPGPSTMQPQAPPTVQAPPAPISRRSYTKAPLPPPLDLLGAPEERRIFLTIRTYILVAYLKVTHT
jgi:hypothetical protein